MTIRPIINPSADHTQRAHTGVIIAFIGKPAHVAEAVESLFSASAPVLQHYGSTMPQARMLSLRLTEQVTNQLSVLRERAVSPPAPNDPAYAAGVQALWRALDELAPQGVVRNAAVQAVRHRRDQRDVYACEFRAVSEAVIFRALAGALIVLLDDGNSSIPEREAADVILTESVWASREQMQALARSGEFSRLAVSTGAQAAPMQALQAARVARQG